MGLTFMDFKEIVKNLGRKIITPTGVKLLAGMQLSVLDVSGKQTVFPDSILLTCWSSDGGQYQYANIDCKSILEEGINL